MCDNLSASLKVSVGRPRKINKFAIALRNLSMSMTRTNLQKKVFMKFKFPKAMEMLQFCLNRCYVSVCIL